MTRKTRRAESPTTVTPPPPEEKATRLAEEQRARAMAEAGQRRFAFLADLSHVLSASRDEQEILTLLARHAVEELADYCFIDVFEDDGAIRRAVALHRDPVLQEVVDEIQRRYAPEVHAATGMGWVLRTGQSLLIPEVTVEEMQASARDEEHLRLGLRLAPRSSILVPMISHGRVLGAICLALGPGPHRYGTDDLALADELGQRTALALDNARLYRETQEALRRKDEFLAMLAHELRNPLAAISNAGHVLEATAGSDPRTRDLVAVIGRQILHLSRLVDDLLDVSRLTRGQIELRLRPTELRPIVEQAVEATQPLLQRRGQRLTVDLPEEPVILEVDVARLEQVLTNLLDNAAKFTHPGGEIDLKARIEGGQVVLTVSDNGPGIAPELLPRIFDLFVQEDRSLARSHGGLGIGLTLVRSLVERHGGTVEAHSEGPGKGSELTVRLPRLLSPGEEDAAENSETDTEPEPVHVLLVEDNLDAAGALAELLRIWGHEVDVAHDGPTAVRVACTSQPDVVLLDIGLPGMDGYQVAGALRSLPDLRDTLLIALTGYGQTADRQRTAAAGFDHHLVKPADLEALRRLVANGRRRNGAASLRENRAPLLQDRQPPGSMTKERDDELVRR